jgi:DNA-binding transcriptional ArsR family regulator
MRVKRTSRRPARARSDAPFAYAGLERIFHERGRLAVCTCLVAHPEGMSFTELQEACGLTDGNLSRHLAALAEMGIVSLAKEPLGSGRTATVARITKSGRTRFLAYIDELETVVRHVHERAEVAARSADPPSPRLVFARE